MDSEPKDLTNPFAKENIMETPIEVNPLLGYKKVLKQYLLRPEWPDYQEETFKNGQIVDKRTLAIRQGKVESIELKRMDSQTEIILSQEVDADYIGIYFGLVLPDNHQQPILNASFYNTDTLINAGSAGKIISMLVRALPRRPFSSKSQDSEPHPAINIGGIDIDMADAVKKAYQDSTGRELRENEVKWGNPLVVEIKLGSSKFSYYALRSQQEPLVTLYGDDFYLFERKFRLKKKPDGSLILYQEPLTAPFFTCKATLPSFFPRVIP